MKKKSIKSQDGNIEVGYDDVTHVCIVGVIYALLQYLLLQDLDTIKNHTVYVFSEGVPLSIRTKLPSIFIRREYPKDFKYKILRKYIRLRTAFFRDFRRPYLKHASFFAEDGIFPATLIGKRPYELLLDAPNYFSTSENDGVCWTNRSKKMKSLRGKIERFIYGAPVVDLFGTNPQCTRINLTEDSDSSLLIGKNVAVNSMKELWDNSSKEKKSFITQLFDISDDDIRMFNNFPIIFFSQPLVYDRILDEDEYIELLRKAFSHYDLHKVLIKIHPRDTFDYKKYFPEVTVFSKPVNMQLLSLLNLPIKRSVTLFSTAVYDLPLNIEVDWFGVDIHPKIKKFVGKSCIPPRPYNQISL